MFKSSYDEMPEEVFLGRVDEFAKIRQDVYEYFETLPKNHDEGLPIYLYHAVQYVVAYSKLEGKAVIPDPCEDSNEECREKAFIQGCGECYEKLREIVEFIANNLYNNVFDKLIDHVKDEDHPLLFFLEAVERHKEMHSRHLKTDPGVARARSDEIRSTYNAVTGERYDHENPDHKSWRSLIINPLPSDYNHNELDPKEGGKDHQILIELEKEKGTYQVPEPFSIVVTQEWATIFRAVHSLIHFEDYLITRVLTAISAKEWKDIEPLSVLASWRVLLTYAFYEVSIHKLSGGKKKIPPLVSVLIELREMIKRVILLVPSINE